MVTRIAIVTGEASGDLHGSLLAKRLREIEPDIELWGIGGTRMRDAGVELIYESSLRGAIGIAAGLKQVPPLLFQFCRLRRSLTARRPDALVLIDFGTFNRWVASFARGNGIKTIWHMPPGAWRRQQRASRIVGLADKFTTPFQWSYEALTEAGADATLIGHPLLDVVQPKLTKDQYIERLGLSSGRPIVALLPGSRSQEIRHILPAIIGAAKLITEARPDAQYVAAAAGAEQAELIERAARGGSEVRVARNLTYDVLAHSVLAITSSGTATLEAAILNTPMVIIYRGSILTHIEYELRKKRVLEAHVGLPNIIAGRRICPELLSRDASPERIAPLAMELLREPSKIALMKQELAQVASCLGAKGGAGVAARVILEAAGRPLTG